MFLTQTIRSHSAFSVFITKDGIICNYYPSKIHVFYSRSHPSSFAYNVNIGIRCNYDQSLTALELVVIENKQIVDVELNAFVKNNKVENTKKNQHKQFKHMTQNPLDMLKYFIYQI